jgi:NhaP-type Na+/H+ or K+/H+ antiporter
MLVGLDVILGLLLVVAALALLARKISVPYPILLVVGGLLLALVPGIPEIRLSPHLVFALFLPPLLYPAALFTSWRDFHANLGSIFLLAVGLVVFTTCSVGWFAHSVVVGLPLAAAFVLGAIISPPDAVAATAVMERLRVPRRIVTIIEGESLVNDATALVAYEFAIDALNNGSFSLAQAGGKFILVSAGGIGFGLLIGWLASHVQRRLDDPPVQITFSILTPFAATYLPRWMSKKIREHDPLPGWQPVTIVAWTGMRGVVSLAAALALPSRLKDPTVCNVIIFFTFVVILVTLVLQGLSLPYLIRWLKVTDTGETEEEERHARLKANQAALARLGELETAGQFAVDLLQRLRVEYDDRLRQLEACQPDADGPQPLLSADYEELQREALRVERQTILKLRNERRINDHALRRIQRDLDLAEAQLR